MLPDGKADEILAEVRTWLRKHPFQVCCRVRAGRGHPKLAGRGHPQLLLLRCHLLLRCCNQPHVR